MIMRDPGDEERGSGDLLAGGDQITEFLFGAVDDRLRRRVYHLAKDHELPAFKVGSTLYARKSKLLEWIELHEKRPLFPK